MTTAHTVASDMFGWPELRRGQVEAIDAVVSGRDVLAVMPTAYGKSAIYQIAAVLLDGVTVVVSPLIALQNDQVAGIADAPDAPDAVAVNSSHSDQANDRAWQALKDGGAEFVFLSPEQLANNDVIEQLRSLKISLFVVDEAHCVSSWGHDFRPDYLRLGEVIEALGHPTTLALTATGPPPVREEIMSRCAMRDPLVLTRGFDRPNLHLSVTRYESEQRKREGVLDAVADLPKPGLVYLATRRDAEQYASDLVGLGLTASAYHAGLKAAERREVHEAFLDDRVDVVAATSAFGMGIDKPNVRFVVHAAVTDSLDSYYQEIGRSGRDGEPAVAALHYRSEDLGLRKFFVAKNPDADALRTITAHLLESGTRLKTRELAGQTGYSSRKIRGLINLLKEAGMVDSTKSGVRLLTHGQASDPLIDLAARRAAEAAEQRERIDESRLAMMRAYAETGECRRVALLGYFGESLDEPCGYCDNCDDGSAAENDESASRQSRSADVFPAQAAVRHREWGEGVVMQTEDDRVTVFFDNEGYKVLSLEAIAERDLLTII